MIELAAGTALASRLARWNGSRNREARHSEKIVMIPSFLSPLARHGLLQVVQFHEQMPTWPKKKDCFWSVKSLNAWSCAVFAILSSWDPTQ